MAFFALAKADKHPHEDHHHSHPTASPVYTYYAPYPTTTSTTTTTTTTTTAKPYVHYDSYYAPTTEVYESGGLYYYYYPNENEVDYDIPEVPETTTTAVIEEEVDENLGTIAKLLLILIGISVVFPSRKSVSVRRKRGL